MSTNLHPDLAKGLFQPRRKDPGERALERRERGDDRTDTGPPATGEDHLERAAENNDGRNGGQDGGQDDGHDGDKEHD